MVWYGMVWYQSGPPETYLKRCANDTSAICLCPSKKTEKSNAATSKNRKTRIFLLGTNRRANDTFALLDGMVWHGMVWYDMVWYGMVWYGINQDLLQPI